MENYQKYLGSTVEAPSLRAFPFLIIFSGSASGVAKGKLWGRPRVSASGSHD
jgi:hypothetical protein